MHSLHRVRLATSGSLGAGSYPCYATRFGEESTLFSRNRGRRSGWLASFSWLRLTHRATRPNLHLLLPLLFSLFSPLLFFFFSVGRARCKDSARRRDVCRCIVAATMNDGHSSSSCCIVAAAYLRTSIIQTSHLQ